jgi:hypothetical protein
VESPKLLRQLAAPWVPVRLGSKLKAVEKERGVDMDSVMIIRVVAAVLFVAVLVLLIQRRRTKVK